MVWTVLKTHFRRLLHNRTELALMFVVPVVFFSIFALIFGRGVGATPKIKVVIADEVGSAESERIAKTLAESPGLRSMSETPPANLTRADATKLVRQGSVSLAIVLHRQAGGFGADLLSDASDQVAGQVVTAIVTRSLAIDSVRRGRPPLATNVTPTDPTSAQDGGTIATAGFLEPLDDLGPLSNEDERVKLIDVMGEGKSNPIVSMYAAGIAVMFLLFGATTGGGVFLEEKESQTLDRLLSTRLTMDQLLIGKWFFLTATGFVQVTTMFLWGQLVFSIDLLGHLDGFVMMTVVTSAAASALGLMLATLCKTRGQLNALAVIVVLTMSALGGSMVPRYVMSPELRQAGLWTFNAWALDGYDKVFWRELPVSSLAPQLAVLLASAFVFLALARLLAIRWERS